MSNSSSLRSSRANSRASSIDVVVRDEAAQLEMVRRRLEEEAVDDIAPVDEDHHLGEFIVVWLWIKLLLVGPFEKCLDKDHLMILIYKQSKSVSTVNL